MMETHIAVIELTLEGKTEEETDDIFKNYFVRIPKVTPWEK